MSTDSLLTVTLNAAVDRTYRIDGFTLDRVHRPSKQVVVAGGKGVNVARVYRTLGGHAVVTGFAGGLNGRLIQNALRREGMPQSFQQTRDESRVCIAVVDPANGTQTEVNEMGPLVSQAELKGLRARLRKLLREVQPRWLALCGSAAPGCPAEVYAGLARIGADAGATVILDTSGEHLRAGIEGRPWMVKPNIHELEWLVGASLESDVEIAAAARQVLLPRCQVVCVTLGGRGAICVTNHQAWLLKPPEIRFVSAVGSGDAFVAAFLWRYNSTGNAAQSLVWGVAAGAANAEVYGAGFCSRTHIEELAARCGQPVSLS